MTVLDKWDIIRDKVLQTEGRFYATDIWRWYGNIIPDTEQDRNQADITRRYLWKLHEEDLIDTERLENGRRQFWVKGSDTPPETPKVIEPTLKAYNSTTDTIEAVKELLCVKDRLQALTEERNALAKELTEVRTDKRQLEIQIENMR